MSTDTYISFVIASLVFGIVPGPSVCFTIAHAMRHGSRLTAPTILGQAAANAVQLLLISVGLASVLERSALFCLGFKLVGAAYLVYLGVRTLRSLEPPIEADKRLSAEGTKALRAFVDGFIVCGTNPKALLYYAAFLPQFISPEANTTEQLLILGISALAVGTLVLAGYTVLASRARYWLLDRGLWRLQTRACGALIIAAGAALALVDD